MAAASSSSSKWQPAIEDDGSAPSAATNVWILCGMDSDGDPIPIRTMTSSSSPICMYSVRYDSDTKTDAVLVKPGNIRDIGIPHIIKTVTKKRTTLSSSSFSSSLSSSKGSTTTTIATLSSKRQTKFIGATEVGDELLSNHQRDAKTKLLQLDNHSIVCFADGGCIGNPGPCGSGVVVCLPHEPTTTIGNINEYDGRMNRLKACHVDDQSVGEWRQLSQPLLQYGNEVNYNRGQALYSIVLLQL
jgi:hypothetical protein